MYHQVFNMKNNILIFSTLLLIISCDIEEGPYIADYDSYVNPEKKVLIEDYTGHLCPDCPEAGREIKAIQDIYGNQVIALAIHVSKTFARPYPESQAPKFQYDFRTQWGDNWDETFSISNLGLPRGMVNRLSYPSNHQLGKDEWAGIVAQELKKEIDFKISITSNNSNINVNTEVVNTLINKHNIFICLAENNIINWQKDGQEEVENYEHNHILRSVIADESISNSYELTSGQIIEKEYSYDINSLEQVNIDYSNSIELGNGNSGDWNINNMTVIAFIYNTENKEIVQVEEANLN